MVEVASANLLIQSNECYFIIIIVILLLCIDNCNHNYKFMLFFFLLLLLYSPFFFSTFFFSPFFVSSINRGAARWFAMPAAAIDEKKKIGLNGIAKPETSVKHQLGSLPSSSFFLFVFEGKS